MNSKAALQSYVGLPARKALLSVNSSEHFLHYCPLLFSQSKQDLTRNATFTFVTTCVFERDEQASIFLTV